MRDSLFWLGLSLFLVAISLTAVLMAALPAFQEVARAARSAEKLFDTLNREFPPTLEAIRLTGTEITELSDEINQGVESACRVVKQVDRSLSNVKKQAKQARTNTHGFIVGVKAAWKVWNNSTKKRRFSASRSPNINDLMSLRQPHQIDDNFE